MLYRANYKHPLKDGDFWRRIDELKKKKPSPSTAPKDASERFPRSNESSLPGAAKSRGGGCIKGD